MSTLRNTAAINMLNEKVFNIILTFSVPQQLTRSIFLFVVVGATWTVDIGLSSSVVHVVVGATIYISKLFCQYFHLDITKTHC